MLRRLLRRCLLSLSALSLLLCVAVSALGVRSHWRRDSAGAHVSLGTGYDGTNKEWFCQSDRGLLRFVSSVHRYYIADTTGEGFIVWTGTRYTASSHPAPSPFDPSNTAALLPPAGAYFAGFGAGRYYKRNSSPDGNWAIRDQSIIVLPHWAAAILLLLAAMPLLTRVRFALRRRRRLRRNLCLQCGYDLRASESLCPECGTAVANA